MTKNFNPPPPPAVNIDLTKAPDIRCENEGCGNYTFQEVFLIKFLSKLVHPEGKDGIVPIPVMACNSCGYVNDMFLPSYLKRSSQETPSTSTEPTQPSAPKIEIVK